MNEARTVSSVSMEQVRATYKRRDAWWTVLLVDPVAGQLVRLTAGVSWLTPTRLTVAAFLLGIAAAAAFLPATPGWLVAGAGLYYASFLLDCVDGKIARLRGTYSVVGSWLDFLLDRLRVVLCTVALFAGQFLSTGNDLFLLAATAVTFLALFGYLNGAETTKARARISTIETSSGTGVRRARAGPSLQTVVARCRAFLHRHRIRVNLVSAVEFEMAVFVVAPLAAAGFGPTAIIWVAAVAGALLVLFELALIIRFWIMAHSFDLSSAGQPLPAPRTPPPPAGVEDQLQYPT